MKILAVILGLLGVSKVFSIRNADEVDFYEVAKMLPMKVDPDNLKLIAKCSIISEGLICLLCSLFILFG